jgi:YebC/PmpR family DNA-binding regulatory protein
MSGHSKWSTIKRKKSATDAKRGKAFTKIIKELTTAARAGGGNPAGNARLKLAIVSAKVSNMPNDTIDRAIKRGTGELEGISYEEILYEGYGPGGVAILLDSLTDNRNRTVSEIRSIFTKYGGHLGESHSVSWMFEKKGYISFKKENLDPDKVMEVALNAGAEDVKEDEDSMDIITDQMHFEEVKKKVDASGLKYNVAEVAMVPKTTVRLGKEDAEKVLRLMEALEDCDDVQNVYSNFDIPQAILNEIGGT